MKIKMITCFAFLLLISFGLDAQKAKGGGDVFEGIFYDPEVIMKNQKAIDLTKAQRKSIINEVASAQGETGELQWIILDKMEDLKAIVGQNDVDEEKTMSLLEEILTVENKIKKAQLLLMVRIKNILSPEQMKILDEKKKK